MNVRKAIRVNLSLSNSVSDWGMLFSLQVKYVCYLLEYSQIFRYHDDEDKMKDELLLQAKYIDL